MDVLRNLRFRYKIFILNVTAIIAILLIALVGYHYMTGMAVNTKEMYTNRLLPVKWVNAIQTATRMNEGSMLEFVLTKDELLKSKISKQDQFIDSTIEEYGKLALSPKELELIQQYKGLLPAYRSSVVKVIELAAANNEAKAYDAFVTEASRLGNQINQVLTDLSAHNEQIAEQLYEQTENEATTAQIFTLIATLLAVGIFIIVGFLINYVITKPILSLQSLMNRAEAGDLSVVGDYPYQDEVGNLTNSFNKMLQGLRGLVVQVSENALIISASSQQLLASTEQGASASEQIASSSEHLELELDKQVNSIEDATAAIYQIRQNVVTIGDSGENVYVSASKAASFSKEGASTVSSVSEQMKSIYSTVKDLDSTVELLTGHIQEIGKFVTVIHEISTQTNLLSLNAAIEAARAGEAGRGFTVVAEEVRKLADESAGSSQQIEKLIGSIQAEMKRIGSTMRHGLNEVELGIEKTKHTQVVFHHIDEAVDHVYVGVASVKDTIDQLIAGSQRIVSVMDVVNNVAKEGMTVSRQSTASSQEQLSSMEEIRSAADALAKLSEELQLTLQHFRL
ncbi:methyl-accepting chemotaxis protein [Paenibacillus radicis (ex Xue et al. 2023)]|uniref:Methyl-accepting chemotaxis protein n=1 Tax=Paenibacillus radicis (ex Xue et al. 2023) TaxID=2972489 RepID=A0ABT1YQ27_9BACL|nr:methyl-accepting chemotaxis protein [Paenibacillus radicis (ex Xue et al. 2023)]MCR8635127.1 methyl-accepting chemotaxis protein [Paenibacillus radicis (ex Xue et al. 2023)]